MIFRSIYVKIISKDFSAYLSSKKIEELFADLSEFDAFCLIMRQWLPMKRNDQKELQEIKKQISKTLSENEPD